MEKTEISSEDIEAATITTVKTISSNTFEIAKSIPFAGTIVTIFSILISTCYIAF